MTAPGGRGPVVRMWEARAADGREAEAEAWLRDVAAPAARAAPGCRGAEAYVGAGEGDAGLLVLVTRWADGVPATWSEAAPPGLLARAHAWPFRPL